MAESGGKVVEQDEIILAYIKKHGFIKRDKAEKLLGVKESRARKILKTMTDKGQLIKAGQGRSTLYKENK